MGRPGFKPLSFRVLPATSLVHDLALKRWEAEEKNMDDLEAAGASNDTLARAFSRGHRRAVALWKACKNRQLKDLPRRVLIALGSTVVLELHDSGVRPEVAVAPAEGVIRATVTRRSPYPPSMRLRHFLSECGVKRRVEAEAATDSVIITVS